MPKQDDQPAPSTASRFNPPPPARLLRTFAFDPGLATQLSTVMLNEATLKVSWEESLEPGPVGEYLEVIDYDPPSGAFYRPVDLNAPYLLAQNGLAPSEGNPQFHQQMVYAVAMNTIRHFERALGRRALWSARKLRGANGRIRTEYVQRLRIYPHALRDANAYYSPEKKALLFGYFTASLDAPGANLPGGMIFTCLSHDIIAHEMTHALLDGLHPRFIEPTNPDVLALHEAFADIVALFQHFSQPEVLRHQLAEGRGDLTRQNLLGKLARQFGEAIGNRGALRDAIGQIDPQTGEWKPHSPDPAELHRTTQPHGRGAILVAAVFGGFLKIYRARVADLVRIATGGSGLPGDGELHPDLVARMAGEASTSARHVLQMCIRALDYVPPVDVTFGDYLRALVTADYDLVPNDDLGYRVAMVEAFREWGIYPNDVRSLAVDSLLWKPGFEGEVPIDQKLRESIFQEWDRRSDRKQVFERMTDNRKKLWKWLRSRDLAEEVIRSLGLTLDPEAARTISRSSHTQRPALEVHSVRPAQRIGPDGQVNVDLIVELTQARQGFRDRDLQSKADKTGEPSRGDFTFRGGCTLLVDLQTGRVRYCIRKDILAPARLERTRRFFQRSPMHPLRATYLGESEDRRVREPFALLHSETE